MKKSNRLITIFKTSAFVMAALILSACGSDSTDTSDGSASGETNAVCTEEVSGVHWQALLTENCSKLSSYNLFSDATDPTSGPNDNGIPYDLSTPLFTDYATKYRFVFVPEGKVATYSEFEVMEFPVGTVLVKTFAMPQDTSNRDINETIIETRLLINRADGWVSLPYYWDSATDASYIVTGKSIPFSITHDDEVLAFDYGVPQKTQCSKCHAVVPIVTEGNTGRSIFKPIGPKARFLNYDYEYATGTENQLAHWESAGILKGAPTDKTTIDSSPKFKDDTDITKLSADLLAKTARGYLDINCAHCHRSKLTIPEALYEGAAGDSGFNVEFNRNLAAEPSKFGVCKVAIAGGWPAERDENGIVTGYNEFPKDVIPGHADRSYVVHRMDTNSGRHKMPELGRSSIHKEGVALVSAWIEGMVADDCGYDLSLLPLTGG
jgi:uncharacterized repeat protein (TIGR03806 family)